MSKLKEEIARMINKENNNYYQNQVRVSVSLSSVVSARLDYVTEKLELSKQSFINDIIDAALYDIEAEFGLRDSNVDVLHNDLTYRNPLTKEYIQIVIGMIDDKEKEAKELKEKALRTSLRRSSRKVKNLED